MYVGNKPRKQINAFLAEYVKETFDIVTVEHYNNCIFQVKF